MINSHDLPVDLVDRSEFTAPTLPLETGKNVELVTSGPHFEDDFLSEFKPLNQARGCTLLSHFFFLFLCRITLTTGVRVTASTVTLIICDKP